MQQISADDLVLGKRYIIKSKYYLVGDNIFSGILSNKRTYRERPLNLWIIECRFNNVIYDGMRVDPWELAIFDNVHWDFFETERNAMLRKKNILERPRTINGLSIKEELIQRGPWNPNRINRARTMGYRNKNDPEGNWEPTVVGYGRGASARNRKTRKSRP